MDIITGSETGCLKGISLRENTFVNFTPPRSLNPKEDAITALCWSNSGASQETEVLCAQLNRQLKLLDVVAQTSTALLTADGGEGPIRSIDSIESSDGGRRPVTATESGAVRVWKPDGSCVAELDAGVDLCRMRSSPVKPHTLLTGGRENPLKLWDLQCEQTPVFVAKNVRPNWLRQRVPVWVTDARFMPESENIVTCTGHHQIRLYDPRSEQRRPQLSADWLDLPITAIDTTNQRQQVVAGNTRGAMGLFDLRVGGRLVQNYRGFSGGIRGIECHRSQPYIASCSVDRIVRLHHADTRQLMHKIYCKSRLSSLVMRDRLSIVDEDDVDGLKTIKREVSDGGSSSDSDRRLASDSEDEVWHGMETTTKKRQGLLKRRSHAQQTTTETDGGAADSPVKRPRQETTGKGKKRRDKTQDKIDETEQKVGKKRKLKEEGEKIEGAVLKRSEKKRHLDKNGNLRKSKKLKSQ